jgi:hypothetical protein
MNDAKTIESERDFSIGADSEGRSYHFFSCITEFEFF